jgi:hypothetical protein
MAARTATRITAVLMRIAGTLGAQAVPHLLYPWETPNPKVQDCRCLGDKQFCTFATFDTFLEF